MRASICLLAAAALLVPAGCGGDDEDAASEATAVPQATAAEEPVEVELIAVHDSGQSGTATLTPGEKAIDVVVEVTKAEKGQPAHIHEVTCAEYSRIADFDAAAATVTETLSNLEGARTVSTVVVFDQAGLAARTTGGYSINVHQKAYPYETTACGDIPKR